MRVKPLHQSTSLRKAHIGWKRRSDLRLKRLDLGLDLQTRSKATHQKWRPEEPTENIYYHERGGDLPSWNSSSARRREKNSRKKV
jgi:hypothetical protein